jgi:hypothetical protein
MIVQLIHKNGSIEIWLAGREYLVFGVTVGGDSIACPSIGMAREIAAR